MSDEPTRVIYKLLLTMFADLAKKLGLAIAQGIRWLRSWTLLLTAGGPRGLKNQHEWADDSNDVPLNPARLATRTRTSHFSRSEAPTTPDMPQQVHLTEN